MAYSYVPQPTKTALPTPMLPGTAGDADRLLQARSSGEEVYVDDEQNVLTAVWPEVVAELTMGSADGAIPPVSNAQKAWLGLVKPLTVAQGFALLSVPSSLAQEAIERDLREPILRSLARRLGPQVEGLGVRIAAPATPPADRPGGPPRHARLTSRPDRLREHPRTPREPVNYPAPAEYQAPPDYAAPRYHTPPEYPGHDDYPQPEYVAAPVAGELPNIPNHGSTTAPHRDMELPPARNVPSPPGQESLFAPESEPMPVRRPHQQKPDDDEPVVRAPNSWPTYFARPPSRPRLPRPPPRPRRA